MSVAVARRWAHDLYVVTDPLGPRGLAPYIEALADGGLHGRWALQVRDHDADDAALRETLRALIPLARASHVPLLVGAATLARAELAMREGAAGVHLPERAPDAREVRVAVGPGGWIAASVHDGHGLARRAAQGVDLAVVGPLRTLPRKGDPISGQALEVLVRSSSVPLLGLGGVRSRAEVELARSAGCLGVAVRELVAQARDGAEAVQSVRGWLDRGADSVGNETPAAVLDKLAE